MEHLKFPRHCAGGRGYKSDQNRNDSCLHEVYGSQGRQRITGQLTGSFNNNTHVLDNRLN